MIPFAEAVAIATAEFRALRRHNEVADFEMADCDRFFDFLREAGDLVTDEMWEQFEQSILHGIGGLNLMHPEQWEMARAGIEAINPALAEIYERHYRRDFGRIHFYPENSINMLFSVVEHPTIDQIRFLVRVTLGHERRHSCQSLEFIREGRDGRMPLEGEDNEAYYQLPSEQDADAWGLAWARREFN